MYRASAHPQLPTSGASSDGEHVPVCRDGSPYFSLRRLHPSSNLYRFAKWTTAHSSTLRYAHNPPARPIFQLTLIKGKIVLVTGGAKGIGRMISEGFVQNGATVYISSRDAKACEEACKELNALGKGKADFIAADLYKEDAAKNIADELKKRAGSRSSRGLSSAPW